mmetsp:Transcript_28632/g.88544  ORF Transcript_28632/g.88544 Transcript_28632/m.88544 type:complete len:510 (-) Transcript_28632:22-1551(-)
MKEQESNASAGSGASPPLTTINSEDVLGDGDLGDGVLGESSKRTATAKRNSYSQRRGGSSTTTAGGTHGGSTRSTDNSKLPPVKSTSTGGSRASRRGPGMGSFAKSVRSMSFRTMRTSSTRDSFFSKSSESTPAWINKRRLSMRISTANSGAMEFEDDTTIRGGRVDVMDKAATAVTTRPLPKSMLDDGFVIPSFDVTGLQSMSDAPVGKGCQAYVWSCVVPDGKHANEKVALKVLREDQAQTEADRQSFVREAHLLARLRHANILEAYGVSETVKKLPCLLLSWCATDVSHALRLREVGGSGEARARVKADWPSYERIRILRELASALEFLHSGDAIAHGGGAIAHRDLKPDNFGLDEAGRLKLLDFGLAVCLAKEGDDSATYELTGGTGSRRYMAPEACRDDPYGVKVDVYSWAIAAFEIWSLTGKPFQGYGLDEHQTKVVRLGERPFLPVTWNAEIRDLLASGWHADQRARCTAGHATGVLTRLEAAGFADGDPLLAGSGGCCVIA